MFQQSHSVKELDQCPEGEARAMLAMRRQLMAIGERYPPDHPFRIALADIYHALGKALETYQPHRDPRYEIR